jgi:hypothetical protein
MCIWRSNGRYVTPKAGQKQVCAKKATDRNDRMQMQKLSSLEKTALPSFLFLVTAGEDGIAVFLTGAP